MAEDSPKRRKANFNEAETEVLIEQVLRHEQLLFAAGPRRASPGQKRKVWELIRHKVNPVAACPRGVEDLKKRWRDLKRRDRSKLGCRLGHGAASEGEEASSPAITAQAPDLLLLRRAFAGPIAGGGIDTLDLPSSSSSSSSSAPTPETGFTDDPGPSHQPCAEKVNLKEEIVVKVVEPEESSEDMAVVPPSQEQLPFLGVQNGSPCGKVKAKTKTQPQINPSEITEADLLHIQQNQLHVIQSGFESINHNLRLLQQGMQELNNSLSVMAHTLVAIKDVYVKNNAGPATFATVTTQTTAGYMSPGSPLVEDRARVPEAGSSSRSSSSSSTSQEPGPSEFPRPPHRTIKKEHPNGCYYFCFADV